MGSFLGSCWWWPPALPPLLHVALAGLLLLPHFDAVLEAEAGLAYPPPLLALGVAAATATDTLPPPPCRLLALDVAAGLKHPPSDIWRFFAVLILQLPVWAA